MSTQLHEPLLTVEEFERLPDDGWRYELVRGRLVREPPGGLDHGHLAARIAVLLGSFVYERHLGRLYVADTGFLLAPDPPTVRAPDVAFVSEARLPSREESARFGRLAPDLAVEVVSPWNTAADILDKALDYLDAGSRLVWVVEPASGTVTEYRSGDRIRLSRGDDILWGYDVLPGFGIAVAEIFAGPPAS